MVWKINKHKKSDRQGKTERQGRTERQRRVIKKKKPVVENQPKLRSCLKSEELVKQRDSLNDSSKHQDDPSNNKAREQSLKSTGSRGARSSSGIVSTDVESKGSVNSSLLFNNRKRVASVEQQSASSRSWDRESRKSETGHSAHSAHSSQASERSSAADSRSHRSHVKEPKKKVHFAAILIRDYERVVGDNPSCTIGPPVGIGWKYGETRVIDIDRYEASRYPKRSTSRLILSREEREALLLNWGASFHDIIEAVRGNLKIKNQRRQTVTNLGKIERIEEAFETATRKLKSALMLRRSTGNKVRRLQEQANLAQSALTSLKIAEDRALSEIRGTRHVEIEEEPKTQEDFNSFPLSNYGPPPSNYGPPPSEDSEIRRPHLIPEEKEQPSKYSMAGNSITQSEMEIERFYRELELEMFGEEELPSMVGQMLEVPLRNGDRNYFRDSDFRSEESSVNSGMTDRHSKDGLDDELLEREQHRSMISQFLLEDADNESPRVDRAEQDQGEQDVNHFFYSLQPSQPLHMDQMATQNHPPWNSTSPMDFQASRAMEYQDSYHGKQQTIPLHAGMTMFEDCALLGGQSGTSYRRERTRRSSRKKDLNAGPKIQFMPPPTHLTPSHWMDGSDPLIIPCGGQDTITISEDDYPERRQFSGQGSHFYYGNTFPPNFY